MLNIFKKKTLVNLADFESLYNMEILTQLSVPQEKEALQMKSVTEVYLYQRIENNKILNSISSTLIEAKVSSPDFQSFINKTSIINDVLKKIDVKRNLNGGLKELINKDQILQYWDTWRKNELHKHFSTLREQENFIEMMDLGIPKLEMNLKNELQYLILLPECYKFKDYIDPIDKAYTSLYIYTPKLIQDLEFEYKLTPIEINESEDALNIQLKSNWTNKNEIKSTLKNSQVPEYSNISFNLILDYCFDKETGKILNSCLKLEEAINENLHYKVNMSLKGKGNDAKNGW